LFRGYLTRSQEFKIFEIASAVTDALTANVCTWPVPENARDVLDQLLRLLTSSRGGNKALSMMLRMKIVYIEEKRPLLLEPSSGIQEVFEDSQNYQIRAANAFISVSDSGPGHIFISPLNIAIPGQDGGTDIQRSDEVCTGEPDIELWHAQEQSLLDGPDPSWFTIMDHYRGSRHRQDTDKHMDLV
jgi:hypothetical protein